MPINMKQKKQIAKPTNGLCNLLLFYALCPE